MLRLGPVPGKYGTLVLTRGVRTKGRSRALSDAEEDALLKQLEEKYEQAKLRLAKEEEENRKAGTEDPLAELHRSLKLGPKPGTSNETPTRPIDSHNSTLWDQVLSKSDRLKLATYGIKTFDQLESAYQEADADLNRPPYPSVERLRPRLRLAYQLHKSIPQKLIGKGPKPRI